MSTGWEREKGEARRQREPLTSLDEHEPVRPRSLSSTSRSRALALAHLVTGVLKLSSNTVLTVCCKAGPRAAVDQGEQGGGSTGRSREGEGREGRRQGVGEREEQEGALERGGQRRRG
jgi:hypothetical protein